MDPILTHMVLKLPQGCDASEYVLSFEIGQREGGFYSARTDRHTQQRISIQIYQDFSYITEDITPLTPVVTPVEHPDELLPHTFVIVARVQPNINIHGRERLTKATLQQMLHIVANSSSDLLPTSVTNLYSTSVFVRNF